MSQALFLGAHPDDVEVSAGGTVARLVDEDWDVVIAVLPQGFFDSGRNMEGQAAARILGATYRMYAPQAVNHLISLIERDYPMPDLIVTPPPIDSHQDHRAVTKIGFALARENRTELWHMNFAIPGRISSPPLNHFVRFGLNAQERKELALQAHTSQWLKYGGEVWAALIANRDRYYGELLGASYAEGFERVYSFQ